MTDSWLPLEEIELPSLKKKVLCRRPTPNDLIFTGLDVAMFADDIEKLTSDAVSTILRKRQAALSKVKSIEEIANAVVMLAVIEPEIVADRAMVKDRAAQVWIGHLPAMDRLYVTAWAMGGEVAERAHAFFLRAGGEGAGVEPVPDEPDAGAAAEPADGAAAAPAGAAAGVR